jgi:hypothetical protein
MVGMGGPNRLRRYRSTHEPVPQVLLVLSTSAMASRIKCHYHRGEQLEDAAQTIEKGHHVTVSVHGDDE